MDGEGDNHDGKVIMMERPKSLIDLLDLGTGRPAASHREAVKPAPPATRVPPPPAGEPPEPLPEQSPPPKKADPLPVPGDRYRAHADFLSRLSTDQPCLHFVDRDCFSVGYDYRDLRRVDWAASGRSGVGPVIVLYFVNWLVTEVRIEGRQLDNVRYWIGERMMPWVWEQPKGFKSRDEHSALITGFSFRQLEKG